MRRLVPFLLLLATPLVAQDGVRFRYTPPVGQVSAYRVVTTSDIDLPTGNRLLVEQAMYTTQRVVALEAGVRTVEAVLDSVTMSTPAALPGFNVMEQLEGTRSWMRVDERGRILGMRHEDSLLQQVTSGFAGQLPGASPARVFFAEGSIALGATWSDTGTTTMTMDQGGMRMRHDLTYKLERLEARGRARVAVISVAGTIEQSMSLGASANGPAMTTSGTMRGEVAYDLDASRWTAHELVMTMVSRAAMLPAPMRMTVTLRGSLVEPR